MSFLIFAICFILHIHIHTSQSFFDNKSFLGTDHTRPSVHHMRSGVDYTLDGRWKSHLKSAYQGWPVDFLCPQIYRPHEIMINIFSHKLWMSWITSKQNSMKIYSMISKTKCRKESHFRGGAMEILDNTDWIIIMFQWGWCFHGKHLFETKGRKICAKEIDMAKEFFSGLIYIIPHRLSTRYIFRLRQCFIVFKYY